MSRGYMGLQRTLKAAYDRHISGSPQFPVVWKVDDIKWAADISSKDLIELAVEREIGGVNFRGTALWIVDNEDHFYAASMKAVAGLLDNIEQYTEEN
jgi:hypothetical protein